MTDIQINTYEEGEINKEQVTRVAMLRVLWDKAKQLPGDLKDNEDFKNAVKERWSIDKRMLVLMGLCLIELVPVGEMINEGSKWAKIAKKIEEKIPVIKKAGKIGKFIPDLYPNLPDWFVGLMAVVDTAVPLPVVGMGAELIQLTIDTFWNLPKADLDMIKHSWHTVRERMFDKSEYAQNQIEQAKLAFNIEEVGQK